MSSNLKIPKFCQHCGQAFIAQKTTTRFCKHRCASRAYKQNVREQKIQATLTDQIKNIASAKDANLQNLQSSQSGSNNFLNLRDKEFLSVQEAALLLGASRWTIQRLIQRENIKAGKLGRRTIIPRSEIDNLFN